MLGFSSPHRLPSCRRLRSLWSLPVPRCRSNVFRRFFSPRLARTPAGPNVLLPIWRAPRPPPLCFTSLYHWFFETFVFFLPSHFLFEPLPSGLTSPWLALARNVPFSKFWERSLHSPLFQSFFSPYPPRHPSETLPRLYDLRDDSVQPFLPGQPPLPPPVRILRRSSQVSPRAYLFPLFGTMFSSSTYVPSLFRGSVSLTAS